MSLVFSPPKLVLVAVHFAANADIDSLASLTAHHPAILCKDLVLRILLTYLPETTPSSDYVSFLEELASNEFADRQLADIHLSEISDLSDNEAARRVRKLHLLHLAVPDAPTEVEDDPITLFLFRRAYRVDEEAGMLTQLPSLLTPFLPCAPDIRVWMISSLLPLLRRNYEYYTADSIPYTLAEFQRLPDTVAAAALLSHTGTDADLSTVGRDLRGLIGPWLHNNARWVPATEIDQSLRYAITPAATPTEVVCPGWERVLDWLTTHASRSWNVAMAAIEQWNGPDDVDLGDLDSWLREEHQRYLDKRYARAILACAYLIPDTSADAFEAAHRMVIKTMDLLGEDDFPSLHLATEKLYMVPDLDQKFLSCSKNTAWMRDGLLNEANPLTSPSQQATHLLHGLIMSACLLTRGGIPCTVKRAGDLAFVQDEREQKLQATQLIHEFAGRISRKDDNSWVRARREILWLQNWGATLHDKQNGVGVFGRLGTEYLEAEILKTLLSNGHFSLAKTLYEDGDAPLSPQVLQDTIVMAALNAYDNASNPNRSRGGLKKCDEIMNAFPATVGSSVPSRQRIEALLKATHALSEYKLVLRQGEPFSPIILRVHPDPISIVGKVLEQNPGSYTRIQDFQEFGFNIVKAGFIPPKKNANSNVGAHASPLDGEAEEQLATVEKRVTSFCIEAALREDDFETAYSFVVNRLAAPQPHPDNGKRAATEDWSWRAALQAGLYIRNVHTIRPTHLGTASGNPEIRHLEQRIECLSTALRIAPPSQLQEILKTFRRCEEQLDSALKAEAALDAVEEDEVQMPGGFRPPSVPLARRQHATPAPAVQSRKAQADESPMSLFDLSRATARAASKNFSALSSLHASTGNKAAPQVEVPTKPTRTSTDEGHGWGNWGDPDEGGGLQADDQHRVRKRDQLRDAAMGTLTSGVGWLIGAQPQPQGARAPDHEPERRDGW